MSLRARIVALVLGLTVATLAGLGIYLSRSWSGWSHAAVERDLWRRAGAIAAEVELEKHGGLELDDDEPALLEDAAHPWRLVGPDGLDLSRGALDWPPLQEGVTTIRDPEGRAWRVVTRTSLPPGKDKRRDRGEPVRLGVQVAGLEAPFGALEERFRHGLLLALAAALLLGGGGAALLANLALAPLGRLAAEVDAVGAGTLGRRIDATGLAPELGRLAAAFNGLLGRLDDAMRQQRHLVSRASHALRTPTATILTRAEVALRRDRAEGEYRQALAEILAAARESAELVSHLLTLARLDERREALRTEEVRLAELAAELARLLAPRAAEAGVALELDVPAALAVEAERTSLRELLEALLDNALRYTPRGGRAGVRAAGAAGAVELVVWDTGPGIAPEERARAFDRFQRGAAAQASGAGGSGLGLAIVKAIAEAHGAVVVLQDRPGGGLEVRVTLRPPSAARPGAPSPRTAS